MVILKGQAILEQLKQQIEQRKQECKTIPRLAMVRLGENGDDISYEKGVIKKVESFGMEVCCISFPDQINYEVFKQEFIRINEDPAIHGILLLRPLPQTFDEKEIASLIHPRKDLDGISLMNLAKVFAGEEDGVAPCTAEAVIELLKGYHISMAGKQVVILGRSLVVGRPLSMLFLKEDATVTICHSKTTNLKNLCKQADILVVAIGQANMIDASYVKEGGIVIDVGINVDEEGKLCGDVDFESIQEVAAKATPVPGGVGVVTTAVLLKHLAEAAL